MALATWWQTRKYLQQTVESAVANVCRWHRSKEATVYALVRNDQGIGCKKWWQSKKGLKGQISFSLVEERIGVGGPQYKSTKLNKHENTCCN